jgi:peptidoglycan/xylan/chitin deacetylase (PgdA/CDA1 family)
MTSLAWFRLGRELSLWRSLGVKPRLWWRDDDARDATDSLERLLRAAAGTPLSLAVIPFGATPALARRLASASNITISQHGVDHQNHRGPGGKAGEYPNGIAAQRVAVHIRKGEEYLRQCGLSARFYTPPWNRIDARLAEALPIAGYRDLSGWNGDAEECCGGLNRLDVHIDLLRWTGGPRFRGSDRILDDLRGQLTKRRTDEDFTRPIGLLTHHLSQDEKAWKFLGWFLDYARPRFEIGGYYDFNRPQHDRWTRRPEIVRTPDTLLAG